MALLITLVHYINMKLFSNMNTKSGGITFIPFEKCSIFSLPYSAECFLNLIFFNLNPKSLLKKYNKNII